MRPDTAPVGGRRLGAQPRPVWPPPYTLAPAPEIQRIGRRCRGGNRVRAATRGPPCARYGAFGATAPPELRLTGAEKDEGAGVAGTWCLLVPGAGSRR